MKEVEIISKVVGRTGTGAVGVPSVGGIPSVDLSDYLMKKVWDEAFELKETTDGTPYLYGKLPVVVQYGITMYGDVGNVDIPSIYAGLPIDGTTIYWDGGFLKAQGGGSGGGITDITSSMVVSALGYTPANASDLTTLQSTVNDFLSGSDTDTIINKWKELEVFLSGLSESDNLATILGNKADKATTLAGYGITDAYTRIAVDTLLGNYVTLAGTQTITGEKNFTGGLKVNGSPIVYDATNKYWKLEGDLLVTGGVTMYGDDSAFTPSTIMSAIIADGTNLKVIDGVLTFVGETGGGMTEVHWDDVKGRPTLLSSFIDDVVAGHYLNLAGGKLYSDTERILLGVQTNQALGPLIKMYNSTGVELATLGHVPNTVVANRYGTFLCNEESNIGILLSADRTVYITTNTELLSQDFEILHSGNWSKYISTTSGGNYLALSGGTMTGNVTMNKSSIYLNSEDSYGSASWRFFSYGGGVQLHYRTILGTDVIPVVQFNRDQILLQRKCKFSYVETGDDRYGVVYDGSFVCHHQSSNTGWSMGLLQSDNSGTLYGCIAAAYGSGTTLRYYFYGGVYNNHAMRLTGNDMLVTGGITMYSDIRKKTKLQDVELSLSQIANAPLIEHYYNSDYKRTNHVGSIAQYWAEMNDWFCKLDNEGYYTMEIQNAALASAISVARHLQKYETKTDRTIRKLKKRISALEDELEKLKSA